MTAFDPEKHHRRSVRLPTYDYAQAGAYFVTVFVTVCTHGRECLFGDVVEEAMRLNACGQIVSEVWHAIPAHFAGVQVNAFAVMPNHVHGIIVIIGDPPTAGVGATHASPLWVAPGPNETAPHPNGPKPRSLGAIVGSFKSAVTRRINRLRNTPGTSVWQRSFYDRIIRTDRELNAVRRYVADNPARWHWDKLNPAQRVR